MITTTPLGTTKVDTHDIDQMIERAWQVRLKDMSLALSLSHQAHELATDIGYITGQAYSSRNLAHSYSLYSNYEASLLHGLEGIRLFERLDDPHGLAQMVNTVSRIQWEVGDYSEALNLTLRLLDLAQQIGDRFMEANALNNSAGIYHELNEHERALGMLKQALQLHKATDKLRGYLFTLNNIALLSHQTGRIEQALAAGNECYQRVDELNSPVFKCKVLDTLGVIHTEKCEFEQALHYLQEAETLAGKHALLRDRVYAQLNIGRIHHQQNQPEHALHYLTQALETAETLETTQQTLDIHKILSDVYESCGQLASALHHHKRFHELHTTLFNEAGDRKLKQLEVRHRTESMRKEAEIYRQRSVELEAAKNEAELARESAETASQAKSEFLSNMSHELRTPLNGILGYAQILNRDHRLEVDQTEAVQVIKQSGEHLLLLINDILDIAKIEARKVELRPHSFFLPSFLESVTSIMQMRAQQKQIEFRVEMAQLPESVLADEKRLRQVLLNLLSNAIKFTRVGCVTLRVSQVASETQPQNGSGLFSRFKRELSRLRFEIEDTGVGIASADLERIFLPFEQVGGLHLRAEGTGLGLAISRQLVELMDGQIMVESQLGVGSRFIFEITLPVSGSVQPNYPICNAPMHSSTISKLLLPPEIDLIALKAHVRLGDFGAIERYCDALAVRDETLLPFVEQLRVLARNYEDDAISILLSD